MADRPATPMNDDQPGTTFGPGSEPADPQATAPPGDVAHGWVKVGAQGTGGNGEFTYGNAYFGGDSGVWRQT